MLERKQPTSFSYQDFLVKQQDQRAVNRIENLVVQSEKVDDATMNQVCKLIEEVRRPAQQLEQKLLTELANVDKSVYALLESCEKGREKLDESLVELRQNKQISNELEYHLEPLAEHFDTDQIQLWKTVLTAHYIEDIESAMSSLSVSLSSPNALWSMVIRAGRFPSSVIETTLDNGNKVTFIESISFWIDIQKTLNLLDKNFASERNNKKRQMVRAKVLTQVIEHRSHMISPAILQDLIEERYDEMDPWIANTVFDTFLTMDNEVAKHELKLTPTQKRLLAVSLAVMIGTVVTLAGGEDLQSKVRTTLLPPSSPVAQTQALPTQTTTTPTPIPQEDSTPYSQLSSEAQGSSLSQGGSEAQGSSLSQGGSEVASAQQRSNENAPPQLEDSSSPENSGDLPKENVWKIEGEIPVGYLRTQTASRFYTNPSWELNSDGGKSFNLPTSSDDEATVFTSDFTITGPGDYPIPIPYDGYSVVSVDLGSGRYSVSLTAQNTVVLSVYSLEKPSKARIGLGHSNANVSDAGNYRNLETQTLIGDITQMPEEVQQLITDVQNLPVPQRAARITSFVQSRFTYSLDPQFSDYARAEVGRGAFVRRLFALPYGDCDVVNTVNVALLREAGIPARMAYGYMNGNRLVDANQRTLDRGESHGWAEYFDGTKWVSADATPTTVDEYTEQKLQERNNGAGIFSVLDLNNFDLKLKMSLLSLGDWLRKYGTGSSILTAVALYIAALVQLNYVRFRHQTRIQETRTRLVNLRGKNAKAQMENNFLHGLVDEQLKLKNPKKPSRSFPEFQLRDLVVIPEFIDQRIRARRLKKAEDRLEDVSSELENEDFFEYVLETLSMDPQQLSKRIVEYNQNNNWRRYLDPFNSTYYSKVSELFGNGNFKPKSFRYSNNYSGMKEVAQQSSSLEVYLDRVVQIYYEAYLLELRHRQLNINNKNKKQNMFRPDLKIDPPVSLEYFTYKLVDEFVMLVPFYEHFAQTQHVMEHRGLQVKKEQSGETAMYPPVDPPR